MKTQHENGWALGMDVFVVETLNRKTPHKWTGQVTKIGRRWITVGTKFGSIRFDAETGQIDGGQYMSPVRVWPSEMEYLESTEAHQAWVRLREMVRCGRPKKMSAHEIKAIISQIAKGAE